MISDARRSALRVYRIRAARSARPPGRSGGADIGNLRVDENQRRPRIGSHLSRHASQWLVQGGAQHLLAYATPDETDLVAFLNHSSFEVATASELGWIRVVRID